MPPYIDQKTPASQTEQQNSVACLPAGEPLADGTGEETASTSTASSTPSSTASSPQLKVEPPEDASSGKQDEGAASSSIPPGSQSATTQSASPEIHQLPNCSMRMPCPLNYYMPMGMPYTGQIVTPMIGPSLVMIDPNQTVNQAAPMYPCMYASPVICQAPTYTGTPQAHGMPRGSPQNTGSVCETAQTQPFVQPEASPASAQPSAPQQARGFPTDPQQYCPQCAANMSPSSIPTHASTPWSPVPSGTPQSMVVPYLPTSSCSSQVMVKDAAQPVTPITSSPPGAVRDMPSCCSWAPPPSCSGETCPVPALPPCCSNADTSSPMQAVLPVERTEPPRPYKLSDVLKEYPSWLSQSMELIWHGEFSKCFNTFMPQKWSLMPVSMPPTELNAWIWPSQLYLPSVPWRTFRDSAKVRFCCETCGNGWTSMKGRVTYWFHLEPSQSAGFVLFKLYGQQCKRCANGQFEHAMWYPDEVIKVIRNLYYRIGQVYYNFYQPPMRIDRRQGKPREHHNAELCQACQEGSCREELMYT